MIKKTEEKEKKNMAQVMKENDAVFSLSLSDGFANIEFDEKGESIVQFLDEEGRPNDEGYQKLQDVEKVARFMCELRELRLKDYEK
jgi:hypothetical protein